MERRGAWEEKKVLVAYLRNIKFPVNCLPPPAPDAGSASLFGGGVGDLQRRLPCGEGRGMPDSLTYGSQYLSECSRLGRVALLFSSVEHFWGGDKYEAEHSR